MMKRKRERKKKCPQDRKRKEKRERDRKEEQHESHPPRWRKKTSAEQKDEVHELSNKQMLCDGRAPQWPF